MSTQVRRPLLKRRPTGKFKMQDFQKEDLLRLIEQDCSANWGEMGTMKTSTVEWLWDAKLKHVPNPRVLVVTTKSGKGTYLESLPEVLPDWDVFVTSPQKTQLVIGSRPAPFDVELPDPLYMRPVVVIAHYHCFTDRACIPQQVMQTIEVKGTKMKVPVLQDNGLIEMKFPRCNTLLRRHWDMIVLDEAHRIKNQDAQWTRNLKVLKAQFKHVMTGTGFINNPAEIFSLLQFLYPDTYTAYWKFRERFCTEDDFSGYRKVTGIKPDEVETFKELVKIVGPRRRMLECFPDIGEPIETVVPVDLNPTQAKMYKEIRDELSTMDAMGVPLHSPNVLSMLNRLRQICVATPEVTEEYYDFKQERRIVKVRLTEPSSKLDAAMDLIEGLEWDIESRQQIVVFSNFRDPLELLKKRLEPKHGKDGRLLREGIPFLHMDAKLNERDRYEMWHEQWPKKEHQVFLCTLAVGSESINLSSAQRAIFLDQSWSPKDNSQAIGRIYRPGQTGIAQIIYIRADNTVDQRILAANDEKSGWFKQIFGGNDDEVEDDETTE